MAEFDLSTCIDIKEDYERDKKKGSQEWICECGGVYEFNYDNMCCTGCANTRVISRNDKNTIINKVEELDVANNKMAIKRVYGKSTSVILYPSYNKDSKIKNIESDFIKLQTTGYNKISMNIITYARNLYNKLIISNDLVKKKSKKK